MHTMHMCLDTACNAYVDINRSYVSPLRMRTDWNLGAKPISRKNMAIGPFISSCFLRATKRTMWNDILKYKISTP